MTLGEKIKKAREELGITQIELCRRTGISKRAMINYEQDAKLPRSRTTYVALANALGINEYELLDENTEFVIESRQKYGSKGAKEAWALVGRMNALYAGGTLEEEDMDAMMRAMQDAYNIAKERNKRHTNKRYLEVRNND